MKNKRNYSVDDFEESKIPEIKALIIENKEKLKKVRPHSFDYFYPKVPIKIEMDDGSQGEIYYIQIFFPLETPCISGAIELSITLKGRRRGITLDFNEFKQRKITFVK